MYDLHIGDFICSQNYPRQGLARLTMFLTITHKNSQTKHLGILTSGRIFTGNDSVAYGYLPIDSVRDSPSKDKPVPKKQLVMIGTIIYWSSEYDFTVILLQEDFKGTNKIGYQPSGYMKFNSWRDYLKFDGRANIFVVSPGDYISCHPLDCLDMEKNKLIIGGYK